MASSVEAYQEDGSPPLQLVRDEFLALLKEPDVRADIAAISGWMKAVRGGFGDPEHEPEIPGSGRHPLKYRCDGNAVLIFGVVRAPPRMVALRVARSASAYPTVSDCEVATTRWLAWSP